MASISLWCRLFIPSKTEEGKRGHGAQLHVTPYALPNHQHVPRLSPQYATMQPAPEVSSALLPPNGMSLHLLDPGLTKQTMLPRLSSSVTPVLPSPPHYPVSPQSALPGSWLGACNIEALEDPPMTSPFQDKRPIQSNVMLQCYCIHPLPWITLIESLSG